MTPSPERGLTRRGLLGASAALMTLAEARAQSTAPKSGGTLTSLLTPEPAVLILGVNSQAPTLICASKIYQSLFTFSETLEPRPLLAKSWALSDDKMTYTFHLQEGVKFHDDHPMTADDVIFSIMKFHFELAPRARGVFSKIKSAEAPDPNTVVVTLDSPFEPFLLMFDVTTTAIMPKHIYDGTDYRNNPHNQTPIGTGAFQFVRMAARQFHPPQALRRVLEARPALSRRNHLPYRAGQPKPRPRAADRSGLDVRRQRYRALRRAPLPIPAQPRRRDEGLGIFLAFDVDRAQSPGQTAGRRARAPGAQPGHRPGLHPQAPVVRHRQSRHRPSRLHHPVPRSLRPPAAPRREKSQRPAGRGRAEAGCRRNQVPPKTPHLAIRRNLVPPRRIPARLVQDDRRRTHPRKHRYRRLGSPHLGLGLRHLHQLPLSIR